MPLCMRHLAQAWEFCNSAIGRQRLDNLRDPAELAARNDDFFRLTRQGIDERDAMLAELAADAEIDDLDSVVYYLRFADRIKIGFSRNLGRRLLALPHDELLVVEPGARLVEARRHRQFAEHRIVGEWFASAPKLLQHIEQLREKQAERNQWRIPAQQGWLRLEQGDSNAEVLASLE